MVTFQLLMLIVNLCLSMLVSVSNLIEVIYLDKAWNSVFWKVFKTYDKDCIADIQINIRLLPIYMDFDTRKMKYISKHKLSKNKFLAGLFNISGFLQLTKLLSDYNMPDICNNFK